MIESSTSAVQAMSDVVLARIRPGLLERSYAEDTRAGYCASPDGSR